MYKISIKALGEELNKVENDLEHLAETLTRNNQKEAEKLKKKDHDCGKIQNSNRRMGNNIKHQRMGLQNNEENIHNRIS